MFPVRVRISLSPVDLAALTLPNAQITQGSSTRCSHFLASISANLIGEEVRHARAIRGFLCES
jgi:hypothetical protein